MTHNSTAPAAISTLAHYMTFLVGFVLLILLITVSCYICSRAEGRERRLAATHILRQQAAGKRCVQGISDAALSSCPKIGYSQAKLDRGSTESTRSSCSICLVEYKESDILRLLPSCRHLFHVRCVDQWLRMHATCPVCRNSPVPVTLMP